LDIAATGQSNFPTHFIGNAIMKQFGPARFQDRKGFFSHSALNTAAAHRTGKLAVGGDRHFGPHAAR
jgi:hypothetical protein